VVAFFALLIAGCGRSEPTIQPRLTGELQPITIAQFGHLFLYLPIYVAQDKGYFNDEGLSVHLISTGGDEKTFTAVTSGNAQFGVADPTFTAIARERGQGGKVVASIVNGVPFWGLAFRPDIHEIKRPEDLKGMRIATYSAPSTNYTVMKKILRNNGKPIDAQIVQGAATGSIVAMVKANQADIAMEIEPAASIAVNQGAHIVWSLRKQFGDFAITGLTVVDNYDTQNPATICSIVKAISRAMKFIHSDFEGTLQVAKQEFPEIDANILRTALRRMISEGSIPSSPIISKEAWDKAISLRRETGDLTGDGSFATNVDMKFAQAGAK
jgi:NitT/TauT family transport system substrate-binding protein